MRDPVSLRYSVPNVRINRFVDWLFEVHALSGLIDIPVGRVRAREMTNSTLTMYRACTPVVDREYRDDSDQSPSDVVIEAVATAADVPPTELPPLYEYVDPDALDTLFEGHEGMTEALLSFKMDSWNVFVRIDGKIRVCDGTQPTDPEPVFGSQPV